MSTANKLTYLNGTKQAIKQAINEDFEVIDNNTTFREYADEISSNNAKYKDLIPKETKNATNTLDISNSSGLDKALVTQYGNTYQDGEPTPDAPKEIQVVSGDNTINICGKNLLDLPNVSTTSNGVTSTITNGKLKIVGTATTNWFSICNLNIPLESGTYIFSYTNKKVNRYNFRIKYEDNTTQVIYGNAYSNTPITLNKNATITSMFSDNNTTGATFDYEDYLMLEKGSTATEYEQYQSQTYEVDLPVENLFDKDNANVLNGNLVSSSSITSSVSNRIFYINCQPNTTYTVQKAVGNYFVLGTTSSTPTIGGSYSQKTMDNTATKISITTDANAKYLICWYWNNGDTLTEEQTKATIQAELGTKANHYTEYGTTPIELCKIGDYKDRIYPLNGKWYLEKKIDKIVLNGNENINLDTTKTITQVFNISNVLSRGVKDNLGICNYFINQAGDTEKFSYLIGDIVYRTLYIAINKTKASTVQEFKTWLSTHNTSVYYPLATPTTTEITENNYPTLYNQLNNIKLFEGVNHITMTNESGLDVEFDITYYKDWKLD